MIFTVNTAEDCSFSGFLRDQAFDGVSQLSLVKSGSGILTLSGTNIYFTGDLQIAGGAVKPAEADTLSKITLDWNNHGGALAVGDFTAVSLGGLKGSQDFALVNGQNQPLALTVGVSGRDSGPEIASSRTQFMKRLVEFSDRHQLMLELANYPPNHSKYNFIERCWGILENHWNGALLKSIETVLRWAKTMTWRGEAPIKRAGSPRRKAESISYPTDWWSSPVALHPVSR